jgi:DNA invertase Pin-like site-specific DNA recombinase
MLIGYARVSTLDQNLNLQTDALDAAGCERIFTDRTSGARADRPGLRDALEYARHGDLVVVWKCDRLSRSLGHLVETVQEMERRGIGFRSLTEGIDTSSAGGKTIFPIFAALSAVERSFIQERTRAGLAAARQRGRVGGRPKLLTTEKLAAATKLLGSGTPPRDVATILGVSIPTLYRHCPASQRTTSSEAA